LEVLANVKDIVVFSFFQTDNLYAHLQRNTLEVLPPLQKILSCWIFLQPPLRGASANVVVMSLFFGQFVWPLPKEAHWRCCHQCKRHRRAEFFFPFKFKVIFFLFVLRMLHADHVGFLNFKG